MTEELANEMWRNNTGDVFAKIMTSPIHENQFKTLTPENKNTYLQEHHFLEKGFKQ